MRAKHFVTKRKERETKRMRKKERESVCVGGGGGGSGCSRAKTFVTKIAFSRKSKLPFFSNN